MPGRAQLMTPGQAYEMGGSRFGVPLKVLTNKKALDLAMQKHIWTMQEKAQGLAGGMEKQKLVGEQGLERQRLVNERYGKSSLESSVLSQAVKLAQDQLIDLNTPEGQAQFENIYRALLSQVKGVPQGAEDLAGGQVPDFYGSQGNLLSEWSGQAEETRNLHPKPSHPGIRPRNNAKLENYIKKNMSKGSRSDVIRYLMSQGMEEEEAKQWLASRV